MNRSEIERFERMLQLGHVFSKADLTLLVGFGSRAYSELSLIQLVASNPGAPLVAKFAMLGIYDAVTRCFEWQDWERRPIGVTSLGGVDLPSYLPKVKP